MFGVVGDVQAQSQLDVSGRGEVTPWGKAGSLAAQKWELNPLVYPVDWSIPCLLDEVGLIHRNV